MQFTIPFFFIVKTPTKASSDASQQDGENIKKVKFENKLKLNVFKNVYFYQKICC